MANVINSGQPMGMANVIKLGQPAHIVHVINLGQPAPMAPVIKFSHQATCCDYSTQLCWFTFADGRYIEFFICIKAMGCGFRSAPAIIKL